MRGRQEILDLYLQDKPLAGDVDVKAIARGTPGFNGAGTSILSSLLNKPKYLTVLNLIAYPTNGMAWIRTEIFFPF